MNDLQALTAQEVHERLVKGDIFLVDVRTEEERNQAFIKESAFLPLEMVSQEQLGNYTIADKQLVFYCRSAMRSKNVAEKIVQYQGKDVAYMLGGISQWQQDGYELETNVNGISVQGKLKIMTGGMLVLASVLAWQISPWWLLLSTAIGLRMALSGMSGACFRKGCAKK